MVLAKVSSVSKVSFFAPCVAYGKLASLLVHYFHAFLVHVILLTSGPIYTLIIAGNSGAHQLILHIVNHTFQSL